MSWEVLFIKEGTKLEDFGFVRGYNYDNRGTTPIRVHIDPNSKYHMSVWSDGYIDSNCYYGSVKSFYKLASAGFIETREVESDN